MKKRLFKVRYGYDTTSYAVAAEGADLEKVLYAWREQVPVAIGTKMIHGRSIIAIEPHYHAYTGWNEWYKPTDGEDWKQIERDCPDFRGVVEETKLFVNQCIESDNKELIGSGESQKILLANKGENEVEGFKELVDKLSI